MPTLTLLLAMFSTDGAAAAAASALSSKPGDAPRALHALFDDRWEEAMRENPTWASTLGDRRYNDRWPDLSLEAIARREASDRKALARLEGIDRSALGSADQLNYDLFHRELKESVEAQRFRSYLQPLNQRGGVQTENELSEQLRFASVKDYEDWIARLERVAAYVDQTIALMREGIRARVVHPRVIMERVPAQIENQIVDDPKQSPFYKPFLDFTDADEIAAAERERLAKRGADAIAASVVPAYRRFADFFNSEYLKASRASVGAWDLPDGLELYAFRTRQFTTTDLTPEEIHKIGLAEVARIRAEMHKIIEKVGFQGDFAAFLDFLRTDKRFYHDDPERLLEAYRACSKKIDPELVKLFGKLPRMPYGVKPIPAESAPDTTTAYYGEPAADGSRAGIYWVNLYKPETRPIYEIEALSVHEAVPGHHLQIALAQELGELPKFRRFGGYTAFVEGWGLYSESLGDELGLYTDPYSKFGQLTYEMWRAVRLVVDTGIHHMKWERQRAIDYFKANAAKSEHDIVNEIDRYIAWPGQALAYKIGELKIKELRRRASEALGAAFDIRAFHDVVLGSGAVPLDVLARNVEAYIAERKAAN